MDTTRRICISVPEDFERRLYELRKKPEYERKPISYILRIMAERGMRMEARDTEETS